MHLKIFLLTEPALEQFSRIHVNFNFWLHCGKFELFYFFHFWIDAIFLWLKQEHKIKRYSPTEKSGSTLVPLHQPFALSQITISIGFHCYFIRNRKKLYCYFLPFLHIGQLIITRAHISSVIRFHEVNNFSPLIYLEGKLILEIRSDQSLSRVRLFVTP